MISAPIPRDETARLATLRRYEIIGTTQLVAAQLSADDPAHLDAGLVDAAIENMRTLVCRLIGLLDQSGGGAARRLTAVVSRARFCR